MQPDQFQRIRSWFDAYTRSFLTGDAASDSPLMLKIDHTQRVCTNIHMLGRAVDLRDTELLIAETIGLLHDVGRFEQYRRYGTFNDRRSINHASLAVDILTENKILNPLDRHERKLITDAVRAHNAPRLPAHQPASLVFMQLIRDADKLDIWKLFADCFRTNQPPETAIVQHLPDRAVWEDSIVDAILDKRMARFKDMKSLNDFKLLQLSWVFDINFPVTLAEVRRRDDLVVIARSLPDAPVVYRAVEMIMSHVDKWTIREQHPSAVDGGTCHT